VSFNFNFLDLSSVCLLSYYKPGAEVEKYVMFILLITLNVNSFMFLLTFSIFILSVQTDMMQMDYIEQYIDIEETTKNIL
jgi:hypothetical protein